MGERLWIAVYHGKGGYRVVLEDERGGYRLSGPDLAGVVVEQVHRAELSERDRRELVRLLNQGDTT